jgi:hypothetical protein
LALRRVPAVDEPDPIEQVIGRGQSGGSKDLEERPALGVLKIGQSGDFSRRQRDIGDVRIEIAEALSAPRVDAATP